MNISIICPLYKAEKYIIELQSNIKKQKKVELQSINYIITQANDRTETICKTLDCNYSVIKPNSFSHSRVREEWALKVSGDIIVFITQDIYIADNLWLYKLTKDIIENKCDAAFSRQISSHNNIEKYIREINYPQTSRLVTKKDLEKLGLMTFFFSDAASAIRKETFVKLNGYDNKDLITNEDMYFAYKLISNNASIKYCSDSIVEHSHKYTYTQLFQRYFDTGIFFNQNSYLNDFKVNNTGLSLAFYIFNKAVKDKNIMILLDLLPNFASRFLGMKLGKIYNKLPKRFVIKFSANKNYITRVFEA